MKTKIISQILLTLVLVFVLGNTITPLRGATEQSSAFLIGPPPAQFPVVTIHTVNASASTGGIEVITRRQIGVFVLSETPQIPLATTFVNFSVNGTAIAGVDYVPLVSPASIGSSPTANNVTTTVGFGVILVKPLPRINLRGALARTRGPRRTGV